jgi:TonB family protein
VLLIFLLAFAEPAPDAAAAADKVVMPDWLKRPSGDDLARVWPKAGLDRSGFAAIKCKVNVKGLLYACTVMNESPAGAGFGPAALMLAPNFRMRPKMVGGRPVESDVVVPIRFAGPAGGGGQSIEVVTNPPWLEAPSSAQVAAAYPKGRTGAGHVVFRCALTDEDRLRNCETVTADRSFESAARALLPAFKVQMPPLADKERRKYRMNFAVHFEGPEPKSNVPEYIRAPSWRLIIDPAKVQALFPAQAEAAGVKTGRGVAECRVVLSGDLESCEIKSESPPNLGFGAAAVRIVDALAIRPWTSDGRPVDGAKITVPVQFNLAEEPATPPAPRP